MISSENRFTLFRIMPSHFSVAFRERSIVTALFLVISTPRPERPSEFAARRQSFWPWIGQYEASGICRHIYPPVRRGAVAGFNVENHDQLHRIPNEWADIIPAEF